MPISQAYARARRAIAPVTVVQLVWSLLSAGLFIAAGLVVSITVRRCCFPLWRGTLAATVVALVWICWSLVLGQLLGAVGLLRPVPLLVAALVTAAASLLAVRWMPGPTTTPEDQQANATPQGWEDQALTVGTVVLVLLVAGLWTARTVIAMHRGINDPDSLGYHLPFMATFAHSGYADQHRLLVPLYPVQFYPANDELLSAIALLLTRSVVFAALKNLLFGGAILIAAHALGSAYRAGRLAVAATAVVLGFPVIAFSQPGSAVNDTLLLLALLGGLAVLAHAKDRPAPYVLALACAGLALGVKFSAIVPAAALAAVAVVLLLARGATHRSGWALAGLGASAVVGGSWYLRNAVTYGNPVPPVKVAFGPIHLRTISSYTGNLAFSVAHYLVQGRYLSVFAHGLVKGLGPVGVVVSAAAVVAAVMLLWRSDGYLRGLGIFVLAALIGYLTTPAGAAGLPSQIPYAFVVNLHYAAPALLPAAVAGALVTGRSRWSWAFPPVGVLAVLTSIGPGRNIAIWAPQIGGPGFDLLVVAAVVGGMAVLAWRQPSLRRWAPPVLAVGVLIAVVGVAVVAGRYRTTKATDPVARWASQVRSASIAAWTSDIGDLYGAHARNHVVVLARVVDGAAVPVDTCQGWKRAVVAGHFQYTAVIAGTAWARWLKADPAFRIVAKDPASIVFQVVGPPDVSCAGQVNTGADFWLAPGFGI